LWTLLHAAIGINGVLDDRPCPTNRIETIKFLVSQGLKPDIRAGEDSTRALETVTG
jgi:hypothetical protein